MYLEHPNAPSIHSNQTVVDIGKNATISVIEHHDKVSTSLRINTCPGEPVSNMHIRKLTQKADNYLNYYELDKAGQTLKQAEDLIVCLKELFNADDIRKMYFLRESEQNKGNQSALIRAFSSAIRIKPDMQWNTMYSPDAKPNFEKAKKSFAGLVSIPLKLIPQQKVTCGSMVHLCFQVVLLPFLNTETLFKLSDWIHKPMNWISLLTQNRLLF